MQMSAGIQSKDEYVDFRYVGSEKNAVSSPPQAWQTPDPLFHELMGEEKLYPDDEICSYFSSGFIEYGNASTRPVSIFSLHHGLSFNYVRDVVLPHRESRTALGMTHYLPTGADSKGEIFAARMNAKYNNMLMFDTNLKRSDGIFSVKNDAPQYRKSLYFWGDSRTWEQKRKQIDAVLSHWSDNIRLIRLGHEDDSQPSSNYEQIRQSYLEQDPELWQQWEDEARKEFGHDKIAFPSGSLKDATPFERIVWLRWANKKYVSGIELLIAFLREKHPTVKISSCVGGPFPYPFGYDSLFEKFDYSTTQTRWGGGPNRQEAGFFSKFLTDLSGVPASPCVHIEAYFVSMLPEDVREVLSSVFRGGGTGLQMALFDWFGNSQSDFFGAPERYAEVMHVLRQIASMNKLRQPTPDTAIFYSNINQMATHYFSTNPDHSGLEELFTMLGPHTRGAFQFVSDRLLLDKKRNLEDYRVVYVPNVYYQDDETYSLLLDYVRNGGRLVAFSPDAFKYRTDGSVRPTLTSGNLGKGEIRMISDFALNDKLYTNPKAPRFFSDLQREFGCQTGCDIWRFTFPPASKQEFWPTGLHCLTGNACRWRRNIPFDGPNAKVSFKVTYNNPPDLIKDAGNNLFNRRESLSSPLISVKLDEKRLADVQELHPWCIAWENTNPADIKLVFEKSVKMSLLKLWLHGDYSDIEVRSEGKTLGITSRKPGGEPEVDVDEVAIRFPQQTTKELEVRFGQRTAPLYVAELELWGEK